MMDLLDLLDDEEEPETKPPEKPKRSRYNWEWGDPLPEWFTQYDCMLHQIQRDLRAYEETGEQFYLDRVAANRKAMTEEK